MDSFSRPCPSNDNVLHGPQETKRKLFHSSVYESEAQLKRLYVQTCQRLPAFNCHLFHVREIVNLHTKKKVRSRSYFFLFSICDSFSATSLSTSTESENEPIGHRFIFRWSDFTVTFSPTAVGLDTIYTANFFKAGNSVTLG